MIILATFSTTSFNDSERTEDNDSFTNHFFKSKFLAIEEPNLDNESQNIAPLLLEVLSKKNAPYITFKQQNVKLSTVLCLEN